VFKCGYIVFFTKFLAFATLNDLFHVTAQAENTKHKIIHMKVKLWVYRYIQTHKLQTNGKQSTVNKKLDDSMYPGQKLAHSALVKKSFLLKTQQLILGTGTAFWRLTEPD
jgi:hypothetical protein